MGGDPIAIFARQRTGSTWLSKLLERNLDLDRVRRYHAPQDLDAERFVVLMRDPWAWLVSFYRFQLHPIWGVVDRAWNRVLHPPVDRWRAFRWWDMYLLSYEHWDRELPDDRTAWLRYEDLVPDPAEPLAEALTTLGFEVDEVSTDRTYRTDFSNPLAKILDPSELPSRSFDPSYYTEKRYLEAYRPDVMRDLLELARSRGLARRFEAFGYDLAEDVP